MNKGIVFKIKNEIKNSEKNINHKGVYKAEVADSPRGCSSSGS